MSVNLLRNSRVIFTTNLSSVSKTNQVADSSFTTANSQELTVLDGFSFSQGTNAEAITISEAGATPVRGQRSFNTSLNPVEFSFSTYIRPNKPSTLVLADESVLWNSLLGSSTASTGFAFTTLATAVVSGAGVLTVVGTGMTVLPLNEVYTIKGLIAAGASQFNTAVTILTSSATGFTAQYHTAPTAVMTAGTNWGATGTVTMNKAAWNENVAILADTVVTAYSEATTAQSNNHQLLAFGLVVTVDNITYVIDNCALDTAAVDFGLDGIATVAWTGKGTAIRQLADNVVYSSATNPVISGGLVGTIKGESSAAITRFITNKLSTISIIKNIGGTGSGNTSYTLALTGGSINISNGITYVTPVNLGQVNEPIGYFTGTRSITGSVNAYLRTGSTNSAGLISDMLAGSSTSSETKFQISIAVGGSSNLVKTEFTINGAALQVPTIDAQAVMSTVISFTAQGTDAVLGAAANYDIGATNDMRIRYYSN